MKKLFSKQILSLLIAPAVILFSFTSAPDKVNFSGEWKLNEGKSELGNFGGRTARSMKVDQTADAMTVAKTSPGFNGGDPVTTTVTLPFDGKEVETTVFGNSKRKSTAKWTDDQTFVVNATTLFERDGQTTELKSTETWTMKDGSLVAVIVSSSPRGEATVKAIYDK